MVVRFGGLLMIGCLRCYAIWWVGVIVCFLVFVRLLTGFGFDCFCLMVGVVGFAGLGLCAALWVGVCWGVCISAYGQIGLGVGCGSCVIWCWRFGLWDLVCGLTFYGCTGGCCGLWVWAIAPLPECSGFWVG